MRWRGYGVVLVVSLALVLSMALGVLIGSGGRPQLRLIRGVSDEDRPLPATPAPLAATRTPQRSAPPATITSAPTATRLATVTSAPTATRLATVTPTPTSSVIEYVVQPGDLLGQIARRFGTSVRAIVELNPGINPDSLRVGAVLRIPVEAPPTAEP